MNDQEIETEIQDKGLTAPRVTPGQIHDLMLRVTYVGGRIEQTTSTVVHAFLDGDFLLASGHSACVSPQNFDARLGFNIAKQDAEQKARNQLWLLEGYALRAKLAPAPPDFRDRVRLEKIELDAKIQKLYAFMPSDSFKGLPQDEQDVLTVQLAAMEHYSAALATRISAFIR